MDNEMREALQNLVWRGGGKTMRGDSIAPEPVLLRLVEAGFVERTGSSAESGGRRDALYRVTEAGSRELGERKST